MTKTVATPRIWSNSAKDCYFRGCRCLGYSVYNLIGKQCRMKQTVIELVKKLGVSEGEKRTHNIQSD